MTNNRKCIICSAEEIKLIRMYPNENETKTYWKRIDV